MHPVNGMGPKHKINKPTNLLSVTTPVLLSVIWCWATENPKYDPGIPALIIGTDVSRLNAYIREEKYKMWRLRSSNSIPAMLKLLVINSRYFSFEREF